MGDASLNGYERNALYRGFGDGRFVDVGHLVGANRIEDGRGVVVADFDRDGRLDLLVQSLNRSAVLLMGKGEVGNYLQLDLRGRAPNTDAVGAQVTAVLGERRLVRQRVTGSGFLSASSPVLHFGLGDAERVDRIEIRWPDGQLQELSDVASGQRLAVEQPASPGTEQQAALPGSLRAD